MWRVRGGACFGLGLASFAADTRQNSGEKAGGDIDFAAFYILPVPSSLSENGGASKSGRFRLFPRRVACRQNTPATRLSGFALGYPLATLGPHFVRRLLRAWHPRPDLPLWRVFLCSICARRCPIGSLNLIPNKTAAFTQSTNWESTTLAPASRLGLQPRWIWRLAGAMVAYK